MFYYSLSVTLNNKPLTLNMYIILYIHIAKQVLFF